MKKLVLLATILSSLCSFSSAIDVNVGEENTITVNGCGTAMVGRVSIEPSITGEHKLTSHCLPVYCVYTNETPLTWFGTKWTIALMARDESRDYKGKLFTGDPQFDRTYDKVIHEGIESKEERDALIDGYLDQGLCQKVYYQKNVPSM
ncbi:MAG: hypothetical protein H6621_07575 [Halobacteriovoraceae bacterium]|nr:hypothetical protein [Halobacteriovoraceae bacterium]